MRQVRALYTPGIPQELLQEVDEFFSRLRGSHPDLANSFSRQQEAQQALSHKRPTTATKGAKPPDKKLQALPPGKSRGGGGRNNSNNNKLNKSTGKSIHSKKNTCCMNDNVYRSIWLRWSCTPHSLTGQQMTLPALITPHAQREQGKAIGVGVHIHIYIYVTGSGKTGHLAQ